MCYFLCCLEHSELLLLDKGKEGGKEGGRREGEKEGEGGRERVGERKGGRVKRERGKVGRRGRKSCPLRTTSC